MNTESNDAIKIVLVTVGEIAVSFVSKVRGIIPDIDLTIIDAREKEKLESIMPQDSTVVLFIVGEEIRADQQWLMMNAQQMRAQGAITLVLPLSGSNVIAWQQVGCSILTFKKNTDLNLSEHAYCARLLQYLLASSGGYIYITYHGLAEFFTEGTHVYIAYARADEKSQQAMMPRSVLRTFDNFKPISEVLCVFGGDGVSLEGMCTLLDDIEEPLPDDTDLVFCSVSCVKDVWLDVFMLVGMKAND